MDNEDETRRWQLVVVRRGDDGDVLVEPVEGSGTTTDPRPVHQTVLPAVGGLLFHDMRALGSPPRAVIDDPYWALSWAAGVYGEDVARVLATYEDPDHDARVELWASRDYLSEPVATLAAGSWLHRWWPADHRDVGPVDVRLLEIEIAGSAHVAEALVEDMAPIIDLLTPHTAYLAELADRLATADSAAVGVEYPVLVRAWRAVVDLVPDTVPGYAACAAAVEAVHARENVPSAETAPAQRAVAWLREARTRLAERMRELTSSAAGAPAYVGTKGEAERPSGSSTRSELGWVDLRQVAPRVVSSRHPFTNLRRDLVLGPGGRRSLRVSVEAASGYDPLTGPRLYATAVDSSDVPIVFPLSFTRADGAGRGAFVGEHELPRGSDEMPRVDIAAYGYSGRPRLSPEASAEARADLEAIPALLRARRTAGAHSGWLLAEHVAWGRLDD